MERQDRLRRNITVLRLIKAVGMAMLTIPIIVLYFREHGLSMQDVMWLQAIFGATMIVLEIPSGYFSDVLGRRRTMIIGVSLTVAGWGMYSVAGSFAGFLVAELLLGTGLAFVSGTDSAMLYDTLTELGIGHTAIYQEGRLLAMGNFSEAGAAVVGGLLASVSMHLPFIVQAVIMLPLIPLAWMLTEPTVHRNEGRQVGWHDIYDTVAHVVITDHRLRWMLLTASMLGASTLTVLWMYQPYWILIGVPVGLLGSIWAAGNVLVGVASLRAGFVSRQLGEKRTIGVLIALAAISMLVIGLWPMIWVLPVFAAFYLIRGVANPIITSRINKRVDASRRATVLSVRQLGVRLVFVGLAPLIGALGDAEGLPTAYIASAAIFGVPALLTFVVWVRAVEAGKQQPNDPGLLIPDSIRDE